MPFFLTPMPPVMDFPNHLTRIWLLAGGAVTPPLSSIYEARWSQASTNVLVDFLASTAAGALPLQAVGKILLLTMFLGPPLGAALLNRALFGRLSWWLTAGVALVWSTTAVIGLMTFQIGLAAALFCAAALRPAPNKIRPAYLAWTAAGAAGLLLIHPFALLFFFLLLVALRLGEHISFPLPPAWLKDRAWQILLLCIACLVPVVLMFLFASHPPGANGTHREFVHWQPLARLLSLKNFAYVLLSPVVSYRTLLDVLLALPVFAVTGWAAYRKKLKVHAGLLSMAALLLAISPFLPMNFGDGGVLPIRFPVMAFLMAFAGLQPRFSNRKENAAIAAILVCAALLRIAAIGWIWHDRAKDVEDLRTATEQLPAGASVLVLQQRWIAGERLPLGRFVEAFPGGSSASELHFASLAVIWRHVFIPTLFTVPGQQPLGVKPPWNAKAVYTSAIPAVDEMDTLSARQLDPYLAGWRNKFEYVLLLNADFGPPKLAGTRFLAGGGFAKLYAVARKE